MFATIGSACRKMEKPWSLPLTRNKCPPSAKPTKNIAQTEPPSRSPRPHRFCSRCPRPGTAHAATPTHQARGGVLTVDRSICFATKVLPQTPQRRSLLTYHINHASNCPRECSTFY